MAAERRHHPIPNRFGKGTRRDDVSGHRPPRGRRSAGGLVPVADRQSGPVAVARMLGGARRVAGAPVIIGPVSAVTSEQGFPPLGFSRFWCAGAVSSFGTYVTLLALQTLVLLTLGGTAQDVGWLNSARWLPYLLLGLVVGALVDRRRRRPVLVATDLAQAVLLVSIPVAWAAGVLSLPVLLVVVSCYGTASLINGAASMSVLPRLVPTAHLQRAHSRIDGADAVAQTAGPALAGLLVKLVGAPMAVLVDAGTYLFSAVMMATIPLEEPPSIPTGSTNLRQEIRDGL